ncbi:MAG: S9 family peptidase, partial [Candidatus Neomarinimicrobiota bacterium]
VPPVLKIQGNQLMKYYRSVAFLFGLITLLPAQDFTLEDLFLSGDYHAQAVAVVKWLPAENAVLLRRETADDTVIVRHDLSTGEETPLLDLDFLRRNGLADIHPFEDVDLSPDWRYIIIPTDGRHIWRRSTEAHYFLYDRETDEVTVLVSGDAPQSNVKFAPDSRKIAYVMAHDLYVLDLDRGRTRRLTTDGKPTIINGQSDWLYEEEFSLTRAYKWSPDSKNILFLQFDQSNLPVYPLVDESPLYPTITPVRYPKVGSANSLVRLGVVAVRSGRPRWFDLGSEHDIYVPRIYWTGRPGEAACLRLDRRQQNLELVLFDLRTRQSRPVAVQSDSTWVMINNDLKFIDDGNEFVWTSERSGFRHIYLNSTDGGQSRPLTSGDWEVTLILDVDKHQRLVYFTGKKDGSREQHVYSVSLAGSEPHRLTTASGWNNINFAPDYQRYVLWHSTASTPTRVSLHSGDGTKIRPLLADPIPALKGNEPAWEFFTLQTGDGPGLNAALLKPPGVEPTKRYPTLIYTYGGPASQAVRDRWAGNRGLWHYYLSRRGYIILVVDNRGTGGRGKAFSGQAYGDIGRWPLHDHINIADWIGRQSWGDPDRIGIWGWSFGGYVTALSLSAAADRFKAGVAVSPVIDFRLYDTAWTERYMGLLPENPGGYNSTNVLSHVDGYKGGLLLVHGTGDDNVHAQNSWRLIEALVALNQPFDLMLYPNLNHSLPDVRYHLYSRMTRFIIANL